MNNLRYEVVKTEEDNAIIDGKDKQEEGSDGEEKEKEMMIHESSSLREKISYMVALSLPVCASFFLYSLSAFILMYFAGHLDGGADNVGTTSSGNTDKSSDTAGTLIFAGFSLANMYANVTGFAFLTGMSSAVDTLASQHNGAKCYEEVGVTLLRCLMVLSVLALPIAALWLWVEQVCLLLPGGGLDPRLCAVMRLFLSIRVWSLPAEVFNASFTKYLMAMGVMRPAMFTALLTAIVLTAACSVVTAPGFPVVGGSGVRGLAWAYVFAMYVQATVLVLVCWRLKEVQRTLWPLFSLSRGPSSSGRQQTQTETETQTARGERTLLKEVLDAQQLWAFMALGVPGCAMICSEWWAFEILTLFASRLGAVAVSAQSIMLQLCVLTFMFPLGISLATSSMVGNALGAKKKPLATQLSKISLGLIFCLEVGVLGPLILWQGPSFVALFTSDSTVVLLAASSVHWLALLVLGDGMQAVASGVMRGAGRQLSGAAANIVCYYGLGLPAAWLLCFRMDMGISGLLLGISLGACSQACVLTALVLGCEGWLFSYEVAAPSSHSQDACDSWREQGGEAMDLIEDLDLLESASSGVAVTELSAREVELVRLLEQHGRGGERDDDGLKDDEEHDM